ncbi:MAG: hypothetical protein ABL994_22845, partial [Verrucomicrobiales bacterium]
SGSLHKSASGRFSWGDFLLLAPKKESEFAVHSERGEKSRRMGAVSKGLLYAINVMRDDTRLSA